MSSNVLLKQELKGRVSEAASVAGYSVRNFSRYLNDKMVQGLPMGSVRNLYNAGFISEETYQSVKQERISEIARFKRAKKKPHRAWWSLVKINLRIF